MTPAAAAAALPGVVESKVDEVKQKISERTPRAANVLRNHALSVLANPSPSAPGSPPGVRTGLLRTAWSPFSGANICGITSGAHYAGYLEHGTSKMAARPFVDRITNESLPEIIPIFAEIGG